MGKSNKGSAFERAICKELSKWWTQGERDDVFWRTSGSGGRATRRSRQGQDTFGGHGDIGATDPIGLSLMNLITFELKTGYGTASVLDCIDSPGGRSQMWGGFIDQAKGSAVGAGSRFWAVVARRHGRAIMMTMPYDLYLILVAACGLPTHICAAIIVLPDGTAVAQIPWGAFLGLDLERVKRVCLGRKVLRVQRIV